MCIVHREVVDLVTSQSLQINRYGLVVTHPAVVLYKRYIVTSRSMVEMWSNFQSIRFVNGHVRVLGRTGKLRTRMCAGGSEICTAASTTKLCMTTWSFVVAAHANLPNSDNESASAALSERECT